MIPNGITREISTGGVAPDGLETAQFTMSDRPEDFAKAIRAVVDTAYSNKVQAVVRELWANALDSHIAAGKADVPFECLLPNRLNPIFMVKDYGVSMTHEEVMKVYSRLWYSTKDTSNLVTGQWGVGSKVFLAETDHASLVATKDGETRRYAVTMTSIGVPEIMFLGATPTDEPDGFEISFSVEESKWDDYRREAELVAPGFKVAPIIEGVDLPKLDITMGDRNWAVYKGPYAIRMGCVVYPVQQHQVGYKLPSMLQHSSGILIDAPLGSVSVTLSREALSFDETTRKTVIELFTAATKDIEEFIQKKIDECKNTLDAERMRIDWNKHLLNSPKFTYKGRPLTGTIRFEQKNGKNACHSSSPMDGGYQSLNFSVHDLENLHLIIDRDEKMPRRRVRLKDYAKGRKPRVTTVLHNPDPKLLANMVRRMDLRPDQLVSITSIYDPGPQVSGKTASSTAIAGTSKRSGLYKFSNYDPSGLERISDEELPEDYCWLPIDKPIPSCMVELKAGSNTRFARVDRLNCNLAVARVMGINQEVFLFTKSALKRIEPDEAQRIDLLMSAKALDFVDPILEHSRVTSLRGYFSYRQHKLYEMAGGEEIPTLSSTIHSGYGLEFITAVVPTLTADIEAAVELGREQGEELEGKYPLLFTPTTANDKDIQAYIDSIDNKEEE